MWFNEARHRKLPITGILMKEKASNFAQNLGVLNFSASNGWLRNFRKRNSISLRKITGENFGVSIEGSIWKF
jgi:hypothetical protein